MVAEGVQVIPDEVSHVLACSCKAAELCKRGNCSCKLLKISCTQFCACYASICKNEWTHQKKRYVVNQNQILKKLNLNLVWNNHSQNCHFEFFLLLQNS